MRCVIFLVGIFSSMLCCAQEMMYFDENLKEIPKKEFQERWRDDNNFLYRWDTLSNGVEKAYLKRGRLLKGTADYDLLFNKLKENNANLKYGVTFLIDYNYRYDLCAEREYNMMTRQRIASRSRFYKDQRKHINTDYESISYNVYYEENKIKNKLEDFARKRFLMVDTGNWLRRKFFIKPALCGSQLLMKPNGQFLVYQGETSSYYTLRYLKPEVWSVFFPENN